MKYMGSKRWMLGNGLGHLLDDVAPECGRFVDLFSGSATVAAFVASRHSIPVESADLQTYGRVLAAAIIERTEPLEADATWSAWRVAASEVRASIKGIPLCPTISKAVVTRAREWSAQRRKWFFTRAYGGHYFSPLQAVWLDAFRFTLPVAQAYSTVALASLIEVAAQCAASPGHTAQPFQPTKTAKKSLEECWNRDVVTRTEIAFRLFCSRHAKKKGKAHVGDALDAASTLEPGDLAFIDPPYSAVHYSRFYHVLETMATGYCGQVSGVGRYPSDEVRPKSDYSFITKSESAFEELLKRIAGRKADAIVTFPSHECSNGLSGRTVTRIASKYFRVEKKVVTSRFSSLGGTSGASARGSERAARKSTKELILHLRQK